MTPLSIVGERQKESQRRKGRPRAFGEMAAGLQSDNGPSRTQEEHRLGHGRIGTGRKNKEGSNQEGMRRPQEVLWQEDLSQELHLILILGDLNLE